MNLDNLTITIVVIALVLLVGMSMIIYKLYQNKANQIITQPQVDTYTEPSESNGKYAGSSLSERLKKNYVERVVKYMEVDKAYKNSHLTLGEMAHDLQIPKHHLSQVINEKMGCGFIELLNIYRIKEVEKILQDASSDKRQLMEIGMEVGFNSKSTFYAAFKKYTNKSPGRYRKDLYNAKSQYQSPIKRSMMKHTAIY